MSYSQEKNPLSRKVSPLNANNPFKRISPLNMAEKGVKHKEMPEKDLAKHKAKQHRRKGGDPDMEREKREEEMRRENNEPIGPERRSSDPNGTKLASYKDIPAEEIPGYDDGAGGFDYENYDRANAAPGAQYTDEAAEAAFKKMKYTTDAAIRAGAGVDLGTIKKSPLNNEKNIKPRTGFRNIGSSDERAEQVRQLSVNKAMRGKRTMKNRHLKPAGRVALKAMKEGLMEGMQTMAEKAKPISKSSIGEAGQKIYSPKNATMGEDMETRARKSVKAPSKDSAKKMSISRKNCKYKK
jgi:hypothetical protein